MTFKFKVTPETLNVLILSSPTGLHFPHDRFEVTCLPAGFQPGSKRCLTLEYPSFEWMDYNSHKQSFKDPLF